MLCLILRRIQDQSEQALDNLKTQVENLDISKTQGEDIEEIARLFKTVHSIFKNASHGGRSCVPANFAMTLCKVLQTSSVKKFNRVFETQSDAIQVKADMEGLPPAWPPISQIISLAITTYRRLQASGEWNFSKSRAYPALNTELKCWNCGGSHHLKDCTQPHNQARIDANRGRYRASRTRPP